MIVKDLIAKLQTLPSDTTIWYLCFGAEGEVHDSCDLGMFVYQRDNIVKLVIHDRMATHPNWDNYLRPL